MIGPKRPVGRPRQFQPWPEQPGERPHEVILADQRNLPLHQQLDYVLRSNSFAEAFAARDARKKKGGAR